MLLWFAGEAFIVSSHFFPTGWLTPVAIRKDGGCWARPPIKSDTIAEGLSVFGCFNSALNVPELILVFIVCVQLDFEHIVKELIFCSRLGNPRPDFQIARPFDLIRRSFVDNILSESYYRSDSQQSISLASIVSKGSKGNLNVATHIVAWDAGLKFHQLSFKEDVINTFSEQIVTGHWILQWLHSMTPVVTLQLIELHFFEFFFFRWLPQIDWRLELPFFLWRLVGQYEHNGRQNLHIPVKAFLIKSDRLKSLIEVPGTHIRWESTVVKFSDAHRLWVPKKKRLFTFWW